MALNTQFSIAVHLMAGLACKCGENVTSTQLAQSVNASPSFVRRVLAKLSKAGLVSTSTGQTGSSKLARQANTISLLDVYTAVDAPKAFAIHHYAAQATCEISCKIKGVLEHVLDETQTSMETKLKEITLSRIVSEMRGP